MASLFSLAYRRIKIGRLAANVSMDYDANEALASRSSVCTICTICHSIAPQLFQWNVLELKLCTTLHSQKSKASTAKIHNLKKASKCKHYTIIHISIACNRTNVIFHLPNHSQGSWYCAVARANNINAHNSRPC